MAKKKVNKEAPKEVELIEKVEPVKEVKIIETVEPVKEVEIVETVEVTQNLIDYENCLKKHSNFIGIDKIKSYLKKELLRAEKPQGKIKEIEVFDISGLAINLMASGQKISDFLREGKPLLKSVLLEYGYNNIVKHLGI